MASPAASQSPQVPAADPAAIRAALSPALLPVFEQEWRIVLDRVKVSFDLEEVRDLLAKWRHAIAAEQGDPGIWTRLQEKADRIATTGANPGAGTLDDMLDLIRRRQAG